MTPEVTERFPHLVDELLTINRAYKYAGMLDALLYIQQHRADYTGTQVAREYDAFVRWMQPLFGTPA